jgi:1-phosphofructokinase
MDRTVQIDTFIFGGMNRITDSRSDVSGKGINVALTLAALGEEVSLIGILAQESASVVEKHVARAKCSCEFVYVPGQIRVNHKIWDKRKKVITELNDPGVPIDGDVIENVTRLCVKHAKESDFMIFSGSMPPGAPKDLYGRIIRAVKQENPSCKCVLDAQGDVLKHGIKEGPYLIKPNLFELSDVLGKELKERGEIVAAARELVKLGSENVLVSLGGDGALWVNAEAAYYSPAIETLVRSTVGAGDSMLSAALHALGENLDVPEALRYAVAAGSAAVSTEGTQIMSMADFQTFLDKANVEKYEFV